MLYFYKFSPVILFLLSGCTNNFKSAVDSIKVAVDLNKGSTITSEYISSVPYASSLVIVNDAPPILLILAFADKIPSSNAHRLTWLSSDQGIIVTENGRIIHTLGFTSANLEGLTSVDTALPQLDQAKNWHAIYDWSPGYRYNFSANVQPKDHGNEIISTDLWKENTKHISEKVTFEGLNSTFTNHFWQVPATKTTKAHVIKSIQYLGPDMDRIEMTIMKPYLEPLKENIETVH